MDKNMYRLRPEGTDDLPFIFLVFASVRAWEQPLFGMNDEQWAAFLNMQFNLQHTQYLQNYPNPTFDIIMLGDTPAGRLYVSRGDGEIRIVDIALLPEYRGLGIGEGLMKDLLREGDEKGLPVTLHVEKNNTAQDFYRRLGFNVEEDKGVYWYMVRPCSGSGLGAGGQGNKTHSLDEGMVVRGGEKE